MFKDENGNYAYRDELTWEQVQNSDINLLRTVFKDGEMSVESTLSEIRNNLHGGNF